MKKIYIAVAVLVSVAITEGCNKLNASKNGITVIKLKTGDH